MIKKKQQQKASLTLCCVCLCVLCVFRLRKSPQTLVELGESKKLLETLQSNLASTEAQIRLIHEQFAILDKYEVPVETDVGTSCILKHMRVLVFKLYTKHFSILSARV